MAQHEARVFIEAQPRYALPTCDLLHFESKHNAWAAMPPCGVEGGGVHRDVSKPLSVCLASVPCMQKMQYAKKPNRKSFILCSNQLANGTLRIFHPRDEEKFLRSEEVWKMDLHTPKTLRDRGRTLEATLAGDAVEVYLKILQNHLCTSLLTHIPPTALGMLAVPALHSCLLTCIACCNAVSRDHCLLRTI